MHQFLFRARVLGPLALALLLLAAPGATAETPATDTAAAPAGDPSAAPEAAPEAPAMRVFLDPETGGFRPPTPEEARLMGETLREMLSRSDEGLVRRVHPDGHVSIDLQGRFMNVAIARATADGVAVFDCVTDAETAEKLVTSGEAAPAAAAAESHSQQPREGANDEM
ncbi:MAG TPA: hypothetical protein VHQ65_06180 [Thermoanaerobaculia bacterium]|nr:hypothetical protein [Thermoanaerobaculia bacterium]